MPVICLTRSLKAAQQKQGVIARCYTISDRHFLSTLLMRYKLSEMVLHCGQVLCADHRLGNLWLRERGYGIGSRVLQFRAICITLGRDDIFKAVCNRRGEGTSPIDQCGLENPNWTG